jgi:N-acylneuraminate cytidylyltransferase
MSKVIAIIPARGGSKGIKNKNIVPLLHKPLLAYSIEAAQASGVIDEIYVSSDSVGILAGAHEYGAKLIERDPSLALDETPTDPVITEFILKAGLEPKDIIVLLQPTSPLRTAQHIREALAEFRDFPGCHCLIGVYEINNKYLKAYMGGGEFLRPVGGEHTSYTRRQDLPSLYMPNGAIYIFTVHEFLREEKIPRNHTIPYLMSDYDSLDIDTPEDLVIAEQRLRERLTANGK